VCSQAAQKCVRSMLNLSKATAVRAEPQRGHFTCFGGSDCCLLVVFDTLTLHGTRGAKVAPQGMHEEIDAAT
jgi:hypothetical protein